MSKILTDQCNYIIIGAWNSAIIQPNWLRTQFPTLIKDDKFGIELITGPVVTLRYEVNNVFINPSHDKIIFNPKEINQDTLGFISKLSSSIFGILPHTPVFAAGCNFVYQLDDNEIFSIPETAIDEKASELYEKVELKELTSKHIRHGFSFTDHNLNISYNVRGDSKTIHYNFDYPLKDTNLIRKASESLIEHYNFTLKLNSNLIKEKTCSQTSFH